jgi:ATPase subunit of ABC transporter with duplicated ATPase domains
VARLSGGERLRAALACTLGARRPPQLLVLDEPTNHLDLDSLRAVEHVIAAYDGALVVVSHDEPFLEAIAIERRVSLPAAAVDARRTLGPGGGGRRGQGWLTAERRTQSSGT